MLPEMRVERDAGNADCAAGLGNGRELQWPIVRCLTYAVLVGLLAAVLRTGLCQGSR